MLYVLIGGEVGDVLVPLADSQTGIELVAVEQSAPNELEDLVTVAATCSRP